MTRLLDAGCAAGTIRADVDARDVIVLIGYPLTVILDGLHTRSEPRDS